MSPSKSNKGKGKRSRRECTPTLSSDDRHDSPSAENTAQPPLTQARQRKKKRAQSSPERVMQSTLAIMADNTASRSTGQSGLAKFSALMSNHQKVDAATQESIRGMKGKGKAKSKTSAKASSAYTVSSHLFILVHISHIYYDLLG